MTRPKNQSAFQNALFMTPPRVLMASPSYRDAPEISASDIHRLAHAGRAGALEKLGADHEVLDRHALGFEERDLLGGCPAGPEARDDLAELGERSGVQASLLQ